MNSDATRPSSEPWPTLEHEILGEYSIFSLTRSLRTSPASGRRHELLRIEAPDWVNIIAVTSDGDMALVRQFRHGTDVVTLEIPGGAVDSGETALQAVLRELEEETGLTPRTTLEIGVVAPNPAFLSNRCTTFLALDCEYCGPPRPDPGEELEVVMVPLPRFTTLIDDGSIDHALVIAAHDHLQRALARDPNLAGGAGRALREGASGSH
jgi:8-oxo-dGTP pyrophosphatase MutT (NUDIX family)